MPVVIGGVSKLPFWMLMGAGQEVCGVISGVLVEQFEPQLPTEDAGATVFTRVLALVAD